MEAKFPCSSMLIAHAGARSMSCLTLVGIWTAPMAKAMMMHNHNLRAFVEERNLLLPDSGLNGFFTNMVLKLCECERLHEEAGECLTGDVSPAFFVPAIHPHF
eukprot:scaffold15990_cov126-Skeletonema_marinoi.AAC.2